MQAIPVAQQQQRGPNNGDIRSFLPSPPTLAVRSFVVFVVCLGFLVCLLVCFFVVLTLLCCFDLFPLFFFRSGIFFLLFEHSGNACQSNS